MSHFSGGKLNMGLTYCMPALLINMSGAPNAAAMHSIMGTKQELSVKSPSKCCTCTSCRLRRALTTCSIDRKSVVTGKSVSVRVDLGGRRIIKKKNKIYDNIPTTTPLYNQQNNTN